MTEISTDTIEQMASFLDGRGLDQLSAGLRETAKDIAAEEAIAEDDRVVLVPKLKHTYETTPSHLDADWHAIIKAVRQHDAAKAVPAGPVSTDRIWDFPSDIPFYDRDADHPYLWVGPDNGGRSDRVLYRLSGDLEHRIYDLDADDYATYGPYKEIRK
ncbi:hypothetical protein CJ179_38700 [Rhodococcus sp. ACS1]|uniref:hypothetical protein n=1 Tax=Rhodococcus sp. ACS1 TaxID=2028570 RepID=UPI000BB161CA|nr:hypothetical protein [Rhodococcus sp. ACS1]PBC38531.1 hypothetical protein CJ179_38700 [Rhodococcus sp. ACS1]